LLLLLLVKLNHDSSLTVDFFLLFACAAGWRNKDVYNNKLAMVSVVTWQAYDSSRSAWSKRRRPPGAVLHSTREPGWTLAML